MAGSVRPWGREYFDIVRQWVDRASVAQTRFSCSGLFQKDYFRVLRGRHDRIMCLTSSQLKLARPDCAMEAEALIAAKFPDGGVTECGCHASVGCARSAYLP